MISEERRRKLLQLIQEKGELSIDELSRRLQVSRMTIHRDLDNLAAAGMARKVRGGAAQLIVQPSSSPVLLPFTQRQLAEPDAKAAVARHVYEVIKDAHSIGFDDSTTVFALAQILPAAPEGSDRLIFTNGLPLFLELQRRRVGGRLALSGGEPLPNLGCLVGPQSIKVMEGMRFDFVVISAAGWMQDRGEVSDALPEVAAFKQALLARGRKRVLAISKSKINFLAPYPLCRIKDFDIVITEEGPTCSSSASHT
jgi:DeoR/GlpR family transcriptional regulator of sugar metabolism